MTLLLFLAVHSTYASPCDRLLAQARDLDLSRAEVAYDLNSLGYLKVSTPLEVTTAELKSIFAERPIFNAPGWYTRQRGVTFRRKHDWVAEEARREGLSESEVMPPELKSFGMTVGTKLEALLRAKLPAEQVRFETLIIRWVSSAIELPDEDEERAPLPHTDLGAVHLNAVLTLHGEGTMYWSENEPPEIPPGMNWTQLPEYHPPSGQTRPGEVLVLTGHGRASALNRLELTTLHSAPKVSRHDDRLLFLFYFGPE